jgi:hypothetical protein
MRAQPRQDLISHYGAAHTREGTVNNVAWKQLARSENVETWGGRAPEGNWLLLCSTWNADLGRSWLQGAIRISEQPNQEGSVTGHQCFVWEVAAVEEPTIREQETGAVSRLVLAPTAVLASNREGAIAEASKKVTEKYSSTRTRWIVRQFMGNSGG